MSTTNYPNTLETSQQTPADQVRDARAAEITRVTPAETQIGAGGSASAGASTFTAFPGPAVAAQGGASAIFAMADAVAITAKGSGQQANGIGVWGEAPLIGLRGKSGDDGAGVSAEGFYGVVATLGKNKGGAAVFADGTGGIGVDALGSTTAVVAGAPEATGVGVDATGGLYAVQARNDTGMAVSAIGTVALARRR